ncbi:DUF374 domain-containing protein [Acetobacteraceae bacterium KSS8]|uniref:DUF374 domain-containing protein n=1 Tax=Endosaccharibacter trunci TaxID=2812733 RepID=A0ABT1W6F9_9PROT|nr:DUF374 domain-containing protein [Acetobacteraceae bacterium KSS8]
MIGRTLRGDATYRLLGRAIGLYLGFALRTTRWRFDVPAESWPFLSGAEGRTVILAFWHEFLPLAPALWMRARIVNPALRVSVLISRHRDGRMITDIIGRWGMGAVAGSSAKKSGGRDKGGMAAVRVLLDTLRDGSLVAITPDGPRGPRRALQPGTARLATLSGVPVIACAGITSAHRRLGSWDRMVLPLPFGRGVIRCSAPIELGLAGRNDADAILADAMRQVVQGIGA